MKRDKSKDTRPGGPDERFDRIERMIRAGRTRDADHAMNLLERDLYATDVGLKIKDRLPALRRENMVAKRDQAGPIGVAAARLFERAPLPGAKKSAYTEDEWGDIDLDAKRRAIPMLEVGGDPDRVANRVIDEMGEDHNIPVGTSNDRKRLVRKVKDHVDRWVDRAA